MGAKSRQLLRIVESDPLKRLHPTRPSLLRRPLTTARISSFVAAQGRTIGAAAIIVDSAIDVAINEEQRIYEF
jgi:hypothetical protein